LFFSGKTAITTHAGPFYRGMAGRTSPAAVLSIGAMLPFGSSGGVRVDLENHLYNLKLGYENLSPPTHPRSRLQYDIALTVGLVLGLID